jgi:hypothetical protein
MNLWVVLTNGRDIIHGPINNTTETVLESGQPFALFGDTKDYVTDLIFTEYQEGDIEKMIEEIKVLKNITWLIDYTEEEANYIKEIYNSQSLNSKIEPIKHPQRDEYAIPFLEDVFETFPEGDEKTAMEGVISYKTSNGFHLSKEEMIENEWF